MNRNFDAKRKIIEMQLWKTGESLTSHPPSRKHRTSVLHMQTHSKVIWDQVHTSFTSTRAPFTKWTSLSLLEILENLNQIIWMMLVTLTHWNLIGHVSEMRIHLPHSPTSLFHKTKVQTSPELQLHHEVEILATVIVARHNVPSWARQRCRWLFGTIKMWNSNTPCPNAF